MATRHGGPMAVALELAKGPVVAALQKYDCFVLYPINPTTLATYRKAFNPSGAKDDPTDAELALDLLTNHPERFKPLNPQSVEMRTLITLVEQRRLLVAFGEQRERFANAAELQKYSDVAPYNEATYLKALSDRGSPLLNTESA